MRLNYTKPTVFLPSGMTNGALLLTIEPRCSGHWFNLVGGGLPVWFSKYVWTWGRELHDKFQGLVNYACVNLGSRGRTRLA